MKKFVGLVFALFMMVVLVGCADDVVSIEVDGEDVASELRIDEFDLSTFHLIVTYRNDDVEEMVITEDMISAEDLEKLQSVGSHEITVRYEGHKVVMDVLLVDDPLTMQMKAIYELGVEEMLIVEMDYEEWLDSIKGQDGIGIAYTRVDANGDLVIVYSDGEEVNLGCIIGQDGREIELMSEGDTLRWKYVDQDVWTDLFVVEDGKDPVFQVEEGYVQWKYVGEDTWNDLFALSSLIGEKGDNIALRVESNFIQWKYEGEEYWTNLLSLNMLRGEQGERGASGVGIVDAYVNETGDLMIQYSNGFVDNVGLLSGSGHTVRFLDGDRVISKQQVADGYSAVAPEIELAEGYLSYAWSTSFDEITGDLDVEIVYDPIIYSLTFDHRFIDDVVVEIGYNESIAFETLTQSGFVFDGWYLDEEKLVKFERTTMPNYDLTLYAKWTPIEYSVDFDTMGGTAIESLFVPCGWTLANLPTPTKTNMVFGGWYLDETLSTPLMGYMPDHSVSLYAAWEPMVYSINYELDEGLNPSEQAMSYHVDERTILKVPTKEGYSFVGWYDNPSFDGPAVRVIPVGSKGEKTLYAKWMAASTESRVYAHQILEPNSFNYNRSLEDYERDVEYMRGFMNMVRTTYQDDLSLGQETGLYHMSKTNGYVFIIRDIEGTAWTQYYQISFDQEEVLDYRFKYNEQGELVEEVRVAMVDGVCTKQACALMNIYVSTIGDDHLLSIFGSVTEGEITDSSPRVLSTKGKAPRNFIEVVQYDVMDNGDQVYRSMMGGSSLLKSRSIGADGYEVGMAVLKSDGTAKSYVYNTGAPSRENVEYYEYIEQSHQYEPIFILRSEERDIYDLAFNVYLFENFNYITYAGGTSSGSVLDLVTDEGTLIFDPMRQPYVSNYTYYDPAGFRLEMRLDHFRGLEDLFDQLGELNTVVDLFDVYQNYSAFLAPFEDISVGEIALNNGTQDEIFEAFKERYLVGGDGYREMLDEAVIPRVESVHYPSTTSLVMKLGEYDERLFSQVTYSLLKFDDVSGTYIPVEGMSNIPYTFEEIYLENLEQYGPVMNEYNLMTGDYQVMIEFVYPATEQKGTVIDGLDGRPRVITGYEEIEVTDTTIEVALDLYDEEGQYAIENVQVFDSYGQELTDIPWEVDGYNITVSNLMISSRYTLLVQFDNGMEDFIEVQTALQFSVNGVRYEEVGQSYFVSGSVMAFNGTKGFFMAGTYGNNIYVETMIPGLQVGQRIIIEATLEYNDAYGNDHLVLDDARLISTLEGSGSYYINTGETAPQIVDRFQSYQQNVHQAYTTDLTFSHVDGYGYAYFDGSIDGEMQICFAYEDVMPELLTATSGDVLTNVTFIVYDQYYGDMRVVLVK